MTCSAICWVTPTSTSQVPTASHRLENLWTVDQFIILLEFKAKNIYIYIWTSVKRATPILSSFSHSSYYPIFSHIFPYFPILSSVIYGLHSIIIFPLQWHCFGTLKSTTPLDPITDLQLRHRFQNRQVSGNPRLSLLAKTIRASTWYKDIAISTIYDF